MRERSEEKEYVVFAVRFETLEVDGITNNNCDIHVYKADIQPEIIGYGIIPKDYNHR